MTLEDAFGPLLLRGLSGSSLTLATRRGRAIPNWIELEPDDLARRKWARIVGKHGAWSQRRPPCGVYNCAGLVWASRRAAIEGSFDRILDDDGYRKISEVDVVDGDLAVYMSGVDHAHVALVVGHEAGLTLGAKKILRGLSKWDSSSREYFHRLHDHPMAQIEPTIEFWTDRPEGAA